MNTYKIFTANNKSYGLIKADTNAEAWAVATAIYCRIERIERLF